MHDVLASKRRMEILRILSSAPATFSELKAITGINHTSLSIHLKKLQHSGLVCRDGKLYVLSKVGKILYSTINKLDRFITAFERNPKFWMEHDLSPIPEELLIRIGDLGRYEIVHCKNLLSYLDSFTAKSQWVKAVSAFPIPAKNAEVVEKSGIVCVTTDRCSSRTSPAEWSVRSE